MTVTEADTIPITTVEGYKDGINYKELATSLPYMYSDKPEWVEFVAEKYVTDQIIDWFGKDIRIDEINEDQIKVTVKVSLNAMEHWAKQYAPHVTVISPPSLVQTIKEELQKAVERYNV